jgi:ABC-type transport system involved in multi-copper enzyme maturation permease subunit
MDVLERLFGSLFVWQMTRDGRRAWPTVARCAVAGLFALFLWMVVGRVYSRDHYTRFDMPGKFAEFQASFSTPCLFAIFYCCLALTPALFSTLIARDRESRLLELLLTTQLTKEQVVLGRWGARFLQLLMVFVSATPILIWSYVFGGARIELLFGALIVSLCAAMSLSAIATLASAMARTTREAYAAAYAAPILIAMAPAALHTCVVVLAQANVVPYSALTAVSYANVMWDAHVSPIGMFHSVFSTDVFSQPEPLGQRVSGFVVIHLSATLIFWRLAVAAVGRNRDATTQRWARLFSRGSRGFGEWPVFLREWRSGAGGLWSAVQRHVFVLAACLGLYLPFYCFVFKPFRKLWWLFGDWRDADYTPFYLWTGGVLFAFALLQVLQNAANSIANERDRDTWQTLLSSRLSASEIVRQKVLASLRPAGVLLVLWIPLTLVLAAQGRADFWAVVAPCIVVPTFALFVGATSLLLMLQAKRPSTGMMQAMGVVVLVFAMLAVAQSALMWPFAAKASRRLAEESTAFTDGLWLLSSPFLLQPFEGRPDPRWIVVMFSVVMLGAAAAVATYTVEEFPRLTGRREKSISLQNRRPRPLSEFSDRYRIRNPA